MFPASTPTTAAPYYSLVSQDRGIRVDAEAGPVSETDSVTAPDAGPFSDWLEAEAFHYEAGDFWYGNARSGQRSTIGPVELDADLWADGDGDHTGSGYVGIGLGESRYQVVFDLSQPTPVRLTARLSVNHYWVGLASVELLGVFRFEVRDTLDWMDVTQDYDLDPGRYTFSVRAEAMGVAGDSIGANADAQLAIILDPATQITAPTADLQDGPPLETAVVGPGGDGKVDGFYGIWLRGDGVGGNPEYRWSIRGGPEALPNTVLAELADTDFDESLDDYFLTFADLGEAGAMDRAAAAPYTLRLEALDSGGLPIPGSESEILLLVPEPTALSLLALGGLAVLRRRRKQTATNASRLESSLCSLAG